MDAETAAGFAQRFNQFRRDVDTYEAAPVEGEQRTPRERYLDMVTRVNQLPYKQRGTKGAFKRVVRASTRPKPDAPRMRVEMDVIYDKVEDVALPTHAREIKVRWSTEFGVFTTESTSIHHMGAYMDDDELNRLRLLELSLAEIEANQPTSAAPSHVPMHRAAGGH